MEKNDLSIATNHWRTISCEETNSVGGVRLRSGEQGGGSTRVDQELTVREDVWKEQEIKATLLWKNLRNSLWNGLKQQLGETGRLEGKLHLPNC